MIPLKLDAWSLDVVKELLAKGYYEGDTFDFKEMLPREDAGRLRLAKTCCAFANSQGGFIVFGISDDAKLPADKRIIGIDASIDFPVAFGSYPSRCVPSVDWSPKNPPLSLSTKKLVHVIQIPSSWNAPHAVRDEAGGWFFAKRTSEGNAPMTIEEVRAGFLGFYEKRVKIQLLRSELETVRLQAGEMIIIGSDMDKKTSLATFDLTVIESVLADTYTILTSSPELLGKLREIRRHCRSINRWVNVIAPVFYLPITSKSSLINDHNLRVMGDAANIGRLVDEAMPLLDALTA